MPQSHDHENKINRPEITDGEICNAVAKFTQELNRRLEEKGYGVLISRHEIFGVIVEEHHELTEAVEGGSLNDVVDELFDEAVAAVFGAACIMAKKVEW